jgi:hypothetical protein
MTPRGEIAHPRSENKNPDGKAVNLGVLNDSRKYPTDVTKFLAAEWNEIDVGRGAALHPKARTHT